MGCPVCFACGVSGFFGGVVFVELFHSFFLCFFQVTFRLFRSSFHRNPFLFLFYYIVGIPANLEKGWFRRELMRPFSFRVC